MGIQKVQFQRLKEKSDQATEFLWTTHLTRQEAWTFYHSCYIPSVTYPLTSSYLSEKQLDQIQQKAMTIIYAKCGFNRHTKREVLFGPRELGGAEFSRLFLKQGIAQTQYFLRHWRIHSTIGKLMKCALAWIQLSLGVSFPMLERVHVSLPHLESKWFASLRRFLATIDATIQLDDPEIPPTQRENDEYIMDLIMNARCFSNAEIRKLNCCRLHLQVVTLADITKPNGAELDPNFLRGYPSLMSAKSTLLSINQDRPSEREWILWRKANLIWSSPDGTLVRPLGKWTRRVQDQRQSHFAYVHRNVLYVREADTTYRKYRASGHSSYRPSTWRQYTIHQIAPDARPVDVSFSDNGEWQLQGVAHKVILPRAPPPSTMETFAQYVQTLTSWEIELLNHVQMELDPRALCVALESGFRAVSDGSVRHVTHGAFGWVLSSRNGTRLAYGMGPASGRKQTSYRAEAYGLLSLSRFLIRLREFSQMHEDWSGKIATDSKSVLDTLTEGDSDPQEEELPVDLDQGRVVLDALRPEWDVLVEIQEALRSLPGVILKYVKGHQDRDIAYQNLSLMAQLNVDADHMAGEFQEFNGRAHPLVLMSPLTKAHLHLPDGTVTGNYDRVLQHEATAKPLLLYIQQKNGWTPSVMGYIDWNAHGSALKRRPERRTHMTKLLHEILPTTGQANKFDRGTRRCPLCPSQMEDRDHILCCTHPTRQAWREKFLQEVTHHCSTTGTAPRLQEVLLKGFQQWFQTPQEFSLGSEVYDNDIQQLIYQQNKIGWRQLFHGRYSVEWAKIQEIHYRSLQSDDESSTVQKSGERWLVNLILFVWDKWYTLWKQRNQELHGADALTRAAAEQKEIRRQLRDIYQSRHDLEPRVQEILFDNVERHYEVPTSVTRNWLATNTGLIRESMRRVKAKAIQGVRSIRTYFNSITR